MEDYAEPIKIYDIISNGQYLNWITSAYVKIMAGPGAKLDPAISFLVAPLCMLICCTSMQLNKTPAGLRDLSSRPVYSHFHLFSAP
ncbi:hypothetical protein VTH82DRAFT_6457 [Thermothelomyces myriococcoides]